MINLVRDPSVEFDEDKDERPDYWTKSEDSDKLEWTKPGWRNYRIEGLVDINLGMRDSYTGQRALRIEPGESERAWMTGKLPVKAGESYELAGFIRSTAPETVKALIRVTWHDAAGKEIGRSDTQPLTTCDWTSAAVPEMSVVSPEGAAQAVVSCVVTPGEGGSVWFDEIVFAREM